MVMVKREEEVDMRHPVGVDERVLQSSLAMIMVVDNQVLS